ncbi:CBS domain-containing protein [Streptomyces albidoflavus]
MTLVQLRARSVSARHVHGTVIDAMDAAGPQVWDDMTVEVAWSVMAAARAERLVVCDEDGLCVGLVTRAQLTAALDSSGYTDRIRLSDINDGSEPLISPLGTRDEAEDGDLCRVPGLVPVVGEHGSPLGSLPSPAEPPDDGHTRLPLCL